MFLSRLRTGHNQSFRAFFSCDFIITLFRSGSEGRRVWVSKLNLRKLGMSKVTYFSHVAFNEFSSSVNIFSGSPTRIICDPMWSSNMSVVVTSLSQTIPASFMLQSDYHVIVKLPWMTRVIANKILNMISKSRVYFNSNVKLN